MEERECPLGAKCAKCLWYNRVRGRNPNTGEDIDHWDCSLNIIAMLQIEVSNQVRHLDATTQSFRNESAQTNVTALNIAMGVARVQQRQIPEMVDECKILTLKGATSQSNSDETSDV